MILFLLFSFVLLVDPYFEIPSSDTASQMYSVTVSGVNKLLSSVSNIIEDTILSISIEDIVDSASTSLGEIEYSLEDISIQSFDLCDFYISSIQDSQEFGIDILNNSLEMSFSYSYQMLSWPYLSESGSGTIQSDGMSIEMFASVFRDDETGGIEYSIASFEVTIDDLSIEFSGGIIADVIDIIAGIFGDELGDVVAELIGQILLEMLTSYSDQGVEYLAVCENNICQDQRFAENPLFSDSRISALMGGTYYTEDPQEYTQPTDFTVFPQSIDNRMVQVFFGPACFSSWYAAQYLNGTLVDVTSAPQDPSTFEDAFPEFAAAFPGAAAVLSFSLQAAPGFEIFYSAAQVTLPVRLTAAPDGGAAAAIFDLTVVTVGDVDFRRYHGDDSPVTFERGQITIELSPYDISAEVASSSIGNIIITDAFLAWAEDAVFDLAYTPVWRDALEASQFRMIDLHELQYTNHKVTYDPDYVAFTFDVEVYDETADADEQTKRILLYAVAAPTLARGSRTLTRPSRC
eukprot:gnl/Chilomastix_cuspidata/778.p1 GENE.gnl/Chilomastix_cuspidata/778~~gnl/Chilomastix_cuspidata/778.p1  ORF type:complete len:517 (+),score=126.34 gnl/Chilomastix_cuspidata/778:25-1575(+)